MCVFSATRACCVYACYGFIAWVIDVREYLAVSKHQGNQAVEIKIKLPELLETIQHQMVVGGCQSRGWV